MADDKRLDIDIALNADTAGARETGQALETVKQTAQEAGQAIDEGLGQNLDPQPVRDLAAAQGEVKAATADMAAEFAAARARLDELSQSQETLATASDRSSVAIRNQRQALGAILEDLPKLQAAFGNISAVLLSGFAGAAIGKKIYDSIVTPIWNAIEEANKATDAFALQTKAKLERLKDVQVTFDGINKAADAALSKIEERIAAIEGAYTDQSGSRAIRTDAESAKRALEERREIAAAGGVKPREDIVHARNQALEKLRDLDDLEVIKARELAEKTALQQTYADDLAVNQDRLNKATAATAKAQEEYAKIIDQIAQAGYDAQALLNNPAAADRAIEETQSRLKRAQWTVASPNEVASMAAMPEMQKQQDILQALTNLLGADRALKSASEQIAPAEKLRNDAAKELQSVSDSISGLKIAIETIGTNRKIAEFDFGVASKTALSDLEAAIRAQTEAVRMAETKARESFATGDPTAQSEAQQSLAAEQSILGDLKQKYDQSVQEIQQAFNLMGATALEGAATVRTSVGVIDTAIREYGAAAAQATEEARQRMADSAAVVVEGSAAAADGISKSADELVVATSAATGKVTAQIRQWGEMFTAAMAQQTAAISNLMTELASIRAQAAAAENKANVVESQVRNLSNR